MWVKARWIAILLTITLHCAQFSYALDTQNKRIPSTSNIKVVSVTPDTSGNFVLLNTQKSRQLPIPTIRFLPNGDGHAVMTVDFPGAQFIGDQLVLPFEQSLIKQVRVGQVQQFPPIMRISMIADRSEYFGKVDFRSTPGTLTVKLPDAETKKAQSYDVVKEMPKTAPPIRRKVAASNVGHEAPDAVYLPLPEQKPKPGRFKRLMDKFFGDEEPQPQPEQAQTQAPTVAPTPAPTRAQAAPKPAPPISRPVPTAPLAPAPQPTASRGAITVRGTVGNNLTLLINAPEKFEYHTFRLSQPDRLVIDLMGVDKDTPLGEVSMPENSIAKAVRIGSPDNMPNVKRIVLDLTDATVDVEDSLNDNAWMHALTLTIKGSGSAKDVASAPRIPASQPSGAPLVLPPNMVVVLDAGHGGSDPGAQRGDIQEKEITLQITEKLRRALEAKGIRVRMTRADDTYVSLEDRVKVTNAVQPNAFVSVHINSLETNNSTTGIETYYQNEASRELAKLIHNSLVAGLQAPDRGVRKARFYVINHTPVPAILAEVGFISNKDERDKLISSEYQKQVAAALADGVVLYLSGAGTISAAPPSAPARQQSFTQNLHSASGKREKLTTQPVKLRKNRLATTRSL